MVLGLNNSYRDGLVGWSSPSVVRGVHLNLDNKMSMLQKVECKRARKVFRFFECVVQESGVARLYNTQEGLVFMLI